MGGRATRTWRGRLLFCEALGFSSLAATPAAFGQEVSAADKATARQPAGEGIKKNQAEDAEGALKDVEKAQALYEAPTQLLYIACSQAKLSKLVEAAETYRELGRAQLAEAAPEALAQAQADGAKELKDVESGISLLTLDATPEDAEWHQDAGHSG